MTEKPQVKKRPKPTLKSKINQWINDLDRTQGNTFEAVLGRMIDDRKLHSQQSELKRVIQKRESCKKKQEIAVAFEMDCKAKYLEKSIKGLQDCINQDRIKLKEYQKRKGPWYVPLIGMFRKKIVSKPVNPNPTPPNLRSILRDASTKRIHPSETHVQFAETGTIRLYRVESDEQLDIPQNPLTPVIIVQGPEDNDEDQSFDQEYLDSAIPICFEPTFRVASFMYIDDPSSVASSINPSPENSIASSQGPSLFKTTPENSVGKPSPENSIGSGSKPAPENSIGSS